MKFILTRFFFCLLLLTSFFRVSSFAQLNAGPNDTINPGVPIELSAIYGEFATPVIISDDGVEGPFGIGFNFSFFGQIYTQFYIGANGWISFSANPNAAGTRGAFAIPSPDPKNPKNSILGPFQDMQPEGGNFIFYHTSGVSPVRKLVVMWCQTPMFSEFCADSLVTFQILLNEGSNTIENMIMKKPSCIDWMNNIATLGVQNETGYVGFAVPGRNATSWSANLEGWKYTPVSADSFAIASVSYKMEPIIPEDKIQYSWYANSEFISSEQSFIVTPEETTEYQVVATLCQGEQFRDTIVIFVIPFIPNAFTPNGDGLNDVFSITGIPAGNVSKFSFQVYDRWGKMIFSTNNISEGWTGRNNGDLCPAGAYAWIVIYDDEKGKITNKGVIMLLR